MKEKQLTLKIKNKKKKEKKRRMGLICILIKEVVIFYLFASFYDFNFHINFNI